MFEAGYELTPGVVENDLELVTHHFSLSGAPIYSWEPPPLTPTPADWISVSMDSFTHFYPLGFSLI